MQTTLELSNPDKVKKAWAFAAPGKGVNRKRLKDMHSYVITSCSREATFFGIRAGMKYEDAKLMLPDLKILAIGHK